MEQPVSRVFGLAHRRARARPCAHLISRLRAATSARGLVATVEHVGDLVDLLGAWGGIAGGGPQVDVPEPGRDGVHRHARLETVRSPVGTQRVRVTEPLGHASGRAAAPHEPVNANGGEGERLLVSVTARGTTETAHRAARPRGRVGGPSATPRAPAAQPGAPAPRARARLCRARTGDSAARWNGDGDRSRARRPRSSAERPAVAEHPQQGVIALAGQRAAIGDAQQVRVVDVGQRLGRTGLVARDSHTLHLGARYHASAVTFAA